MKKNISVKNYWKLDFNINADRHKFFSNLSNQSVVCLHLQWHTFKAEQELGKRGAQDRIDKGKADNVGHGAFKILMFKNF